MSSQVFSRYLIILSSLFVSGFLHAQVTVELPGLGISVKTDASGGGGVSNASSIASDVEMEGVAVINSEVYIDGEKIPANVVKHKSKKSGKTYLIKRDRSGNVSVTEQ